MQDQENAIKVVRAIADNVYVPPPAAYERLSPRECEVHNRLAQGWTREEIAVELGCSVKTIDTHRLNVLRKLELSGTVALARAALAREIAAVVGSDALRTQGSGARH